MQPRSPSGEPTAAEGRERDGRERPQAEPRRRPWTSREALAGLGISLALHAVLLAALALFFSEAQVQPPPRVETLSVEMLSPEELAALTAPDTPEVEDLVAPRTRPSTPPPPPEPPPLRHAATILSDRLGANVRRDLGTVALDTRFEQICGVEAMEQIAESETEFHPERAVAYATADVEVVGNVMIADGAAFLSGGKWYGLRFRCETSPDHLNVTSFDFATGEPLAGDHGLGSGGED